MKKQIEEYQFRICNTTLASWNPSAKLEEEDEEFLQNIKAQRTYTIGSLDMKRKITERRKNRAKRQEAFKKKTIQEAETMRKTVCHDMLLEEAKPTASRNAIPQNVNELVSSEIVAKEPPQEDTITKTKAPNSKNWH